MRRLTAAVIALAGVLVLGTGPYGYGEKGLTLPKDYRGWWHVKTLLLEEGHPLFESFGGIHHVYANDAAWEALKSKRFPYPDGAVFVFDLFEVTRENHAVGEGKRKVTAIMVKDSRRYAETGGWGFQAFAGGDPEKPVVTDPSAQCFGCHMSQESRDYVFSAYRP